MVTWSRPAKSDLKQIHDYIARDSKYYAKKVVDEIVEASRKLSASPWKGRIVPEIDNPNFREVFIYSYRLIYEVSPEDKVEIIGVIHGKRDFSSGDLGLLRS